MERFSQRVEVLVEEKGVLEGLIEECCRKLETEKLKRENMEADLS